MTAKHIGRFFGLVLIAVLIMALAVFISLIVPMPSGGAQTLPNAEQPPRHPKCKTVTARVYNKRVRLLRAITDSKRGTLTRKKQCKSRYKKLGIVVRKARANCKKKIRTTGASYYGYGDSGGIVGACGGHLLNPAYRNSFAILGTGNVASRCGQRFFFHRGGVTMSGIQADTGGGGGSAGGYPRTFDFWNPPNGGGLARGLGLTSAGLAAVQYSERNCWAR